MFRHNLLRVVAVVAFLFWVGSCGEGDAESDLATDSSPKLRSGEVMHLDGAVDQTTIGECEESVVSVVVDTTGHPISSVLPCQICCGAERTEEYQDRISDNPLVRRLNDGEVETIENPNHVAPTFAVVTVDEDGTLYATNGADVVARPTEQGDWAEVASIADLAGPDPPHASVFTDLAAAPSGDVYAAAGNGIARLAPGEPTWLLEPRPVEPDETPLTDGSVVPPNESAEINDIAVDSEGRLLVVTAQQVRVFDSAGVLTLILDATVTRTTADARVVPRTVSVVENVSGCCRGTWFDGVAVSPDGLIYALDGANGRLLRIDGERPVSLVAGPPAGVPSDQSNEPPSARFGDGGERIANLADVLLNPRTVSDKPNVMDFDADGNLFVALGAHGLIEIGLVDELVGT